MAFPSLRHVASSYRDRLRAHEETEQGRVRWNREVVVGDPGRLGYALDVAADRFYEHLSSEPELDPAEALALAKRELRAERRPTRDWAGWLLTRRSGGS